MASTTATLSAGGTATASTILATNTTAPNLGIFQHGNPLVWSATDPVAMFVIQASIIVASCWLLHWPMKMLRQPRVISEFFAGIILGPSVMGRIPGFTATIFPTANGALAPLILVGNLGLIFFLFLVGIEADLRLLGNNWKTAASVATLGMVIPFACGAAIAWGLYTQFRDPGLIPISFGVYLLFVAVAMSITAFPVLCRILVDLKLLHTPVGIVALSAGVANDVVGWTLLALCIALAKTSNGILALYVLLVAIGFILFLCFAVRPAFLWLLKRNRSVGGPSQGIVTLTIMMVLVSAWFTDIIGIHAIFGAFLMGLIIPHDDGFAIEIAEKIEDFISCLFVPVFFALSGLNTNLGLLNDGITWAYVIAIIVIAFVTKITGGALAARLCGRLWRESFAIGALMSCKGVVELIALNIGYNINILSQRTFTMFVVMTLVTTFATTPLVNWLYSPRYQQQLESRRRGETDWNGHSPTNEKPRDGSRIDTNKSTEANQIAVHLRPGTLSGVVRLVGLLAGRDGANLQIHPSKKAAKAFRQPSNKRCFQVEAIRLREVDDRESSIMKVSKAEEGPELDPVSCVFRNTFEQIDFAHVTVHDTVLQHLPESYTSEFLNHLDEARSDMVLLSGNLSEYHPGLETVPSEKLGTLAFSPFVDKVLSHSKNREIAVFVDNGFGQREPMANPVSKRMSRLNIQEIESQSESSEFSISQQKQGHHIFLPFFGTQDDIVALNLVLQLTKDPSATATIVHYRSDNATTKSTPKAAENVEKDLTADISDASSTPATLLKTTQKVLPAAISERVLFEAVSVSSGDALLPLALAKAMSEVGQDSRNAGDLIVLGLNTELCNLVNGEPGAAEQDNTLGAAEVFLRSSVKLNASLLVLKAATGGVENA